jgi:hypothetical protein
MRIERDSIFYSKLGAGKLRNIVEVYKNLGYFCIFPAMVLLISNIVKFRYLRFLGG